ncbi:MAG: hypothetical protein Q9222_001147 [Ikaeria aurantiellina]
MTVGRYEKGVVTGKLPYDPVEYTILAACTAVAWIFSIELILNITITSRGRSGCYFWSLIIASIGCTVHALGFILKFLVGTTWLVDMVFIGIGWIAMVSGQSFVLWSRLNLVVRSKRILHGVLAVIIIDGLALHVPTIVFIFGANSPSGRWIHRFNIMERVQLVGFSLQECAIAAIYIFATVKLLGAIYYGGTRRAMIQLLVISCICAAMDAILIGLEFGGYYVAEASAKPLIYAVKLKMEFAVYSQLKGFTKAAFEDNQPIECMEDGEEPRFHQQYNSPMDFFKQIPRVLKPPTAAQFPTIHTHPEQIIRNSNRAAAVDKIGLEWDSSQLQLSANNAAAAMTSEGGRGATIISRNARLVAHDPSVNPVGISSTKRYGFSDSDVYSDFSGARSDNSVAIQPHHLP